MKKMFLMLSLAFLFLMTSCSDEETSPSTTNSQALQTEMNNTLEGVITSEGAVAVTNNMGALMYLPFQIPVPDVGKAVGSIDISRQISNLNFASDLIIRPETTGKQEDHFVFTEHLGTYTVVDITYATDEDTGEQYVSNVTWNNDYTNTTNIRIVVPASYTVDNKEFVMILNNYQDQLISWYDEYQEYYSGYFPTEIDMEIFSASAKVLDLDFSAEWQYLSAMDSVMPKTLELTLSLPPYTLQVVYSNETANILEYAMTVKENSSEIMSIDAKITFTDETLDEVSELELGYGFGDYYLDMWADVAGMNEVVADDIDEEIELFNSGDYIWCTISENGKEIGKLQVKKVTVTETDYYGNEYTYDEIVPYFKFNDGSEMELTEEMLAEMFGDLGFEVK